MRRLIPTIREMFTNGPFKIFVSESLLALDSNRVVRTSRVFKIDIERELVISVEACNAFQNILCFSKIVFLNMNVLLLTANLFVLSF